MKLGGGGVTPGFVCGAQLQCRALFGGSAKGGGGVRRKRRGLGFEGCVALLGLGCMHVAAHTCTHACACEHGQYFALSAPAARGCSVQAHSWSMCTHARSCVSTRLLCTLMQPLHASTNSPVQSL